MPVDANGTPSAKLGIYKYNTAGDAPSGKGLNNIVDSLDDIISRLGISGMVANDVPVYDSVAGKWKKAGGSHTGTNFLRDDGTWAALPSSGAMTVLADVTLGASQASFDTNTILGGNIPQTYNHLKLVMSLRDNGAGVTFTFPFAQFNGDTAANYDSIFGYFFNGASANGTAVAATSLYCGTEVSGGATAGKFASSEILIPNYWGTQHKTLTSQYGCGDSVVAGCLHTGTIAGTWRNTAAITRIVVGVGSGGTAFVAGSRFTLYGLS